MTQLDRAPTVRRPTRWRFAYAAFATLAPLIILWAFASPLMSSPDEPAHAMRAAAVVRGDFVSPSSESFPGTAEVTVPRYLAEASTTLACFRFDVAATPNCQESDLRDPDRLVTGYTTAGANPPVFYALVGWPTLLLSGAPAIFGMRMASGLICAALLAVAFGAIRQLTVSRFAMVAMAAAVTPMVLFLSATINPNGLEVCAAIATLALMVLILRHPSSSRILWQRAALLAVSAALLANTRTIALLWLFLITVVAVLLADRKVLVAVFRHPASWVAAAFIGLATAGALAYFVFGPKEETLSYTPVGAGTPWRQAFFSMLDRTFDFSIGWIGQFGWLDTPAPGFTLLSWALVTGSIVVAALAFGSSRARASIALTAVALVLVPPLVQAAVVYDVGYIWQGRYTIVPFVMLVIIGGIALDDRFPSPTKTIRPAVILFVVLLASAHLTAFVWALRRYVITLADGVNWVDMVLRPAWQPPGGWIALALLVAATLAIGATLFVRALPFAEATGPTPRENEGIGVAPQSR